MSKINAIRLINIHYNHNTIVIPDQTFNFSGQSTLIHLINGGGKSVMTQLMCAPFLRGSARDTEKRKFSDYFQSSTPSFILVEWALEGGAGYLLTGLMARRRSAAESERMDEVEVTALIAPYAGPCPRDIHHLSVVEERDGTLRVKKFSECRNLFDTIRKKHSDFRCFDMSSRTQSSQYYSLLQEYGINTREWSSIIRRVNMQEGGLATFFDDCRGERDLILKKFLPAVEDRLNVEGENRIDGFRRSMENFINSTHDNHEKLKLRDSFLRFQETGARLEESASALLSAERNVNEERALLARLYQDCVDEKNSLAKALLALDEEIASLKEESRRITHEQFSAEYYREEDVRNAAASGLEAAKKSLSLDLDSQARTQLSSRLQECARLQEKLSLEEQVLSNIRQKLDVARAEGARLEPEMRYLGWILKRSYTSLVQNSEAELASAEGEEKRLRQEKENSNFRLRSLQNRRSELLRESGRLTQALEEYDRAENEYNQRYSASLSRNLMGDYPVNLLSDARSALENRINSLNRALDEIRQRLLALEEERRQIEDERKSLEDSRGQALEKRTLTRQRLESFEAELQVRRKLLRAFDIDESHLYDQEYIRSEIDRRFREQEESLRRLTVREQELKNEINRLETGENVPLPDPLKKLLERLGIEPVYGMQWLRRNGLPEERNRALVHEHPFLPYSLLFTDRELHLLESCEEKINTPSPIPIMRRESLSAKPEDSAPIGPVHFYMYFNSALLNPDSLRLELERLEQRRNSLLEDLGRVRAEQEDFRSRRQRILEQKVTRESFAETQAELADLENLLKTLDARKVDLLARAGNLEHSREDLSRRRQENEKEASAAAGQLEALDALSAKYTVYLQNRDLRNQCLGDIQSLEGKAAEEESFLRTCDDAIQSAHDNSALCRGALRDNQNSLARFAEYVPADPPPSVDPSISENLTEALARFQAIADQQSGAVRELQDRLSDADRRVKSARRELDREAKKHSLDPESWLNLRYSESESLRLGENLRQLEAQIEADRKAENTANVRLATAETRLEGILQRMRESCETDMPLPREEIPQRSAKEALRLASEGLKNAEGRKARVAERQNSFQSFIGRLEDDRADSPAESPSWDPLSGLSPADVDQLISTRRSRLHAARSSVESSRENLSRQLEETLRDEAYQEPRFQVPLRRLSATLSNAETFAQNLSRIRNSYQLQLEQAQSDLSLVDQERKTLQEILLDYVRSVHDQLGLIDRDSTIPVRDRQLKMLRIRLPAWADHEDTFTRRLREYFDAVVAEGVALLEAPSSKSVQEILRGRISIQELYNAVVQVSSVQVQIYKLEESREVLMRWSDVSNISGGETFLSAFVVLSSLLNYMRRDPTDVFGSRNEGKVLIMDNPFGATNSSHLLIPMMSMARKTNTQLICLTGLNGESIYDRFDNLYVCSLTRVSGENLRALDVQHTRGAELETLSAGRIQVIQDAEQLQMLF